MLKICDIPEVEPVTSIFSRLHVAYHHQIGLRLLNFS